MRKREKGDQGRSRATSNSLEMAKREKERSERERGIRSRRQGRAWAGKRTSSSLSAPWRQRFWQAATIQLPPHARPTAARSSVRLPASRPRLTHARILVKSRQLPLVDSQSVIVARPVRMKVDLIRYRKIKKE